ncbi:hypothetical protein AArcSl_2087 [Halalkaliarchaeum desulfuricum]|uniref:Uncharacterized protein n=1 Tax=Halalkaliarchaeum desulfuricum TaxID=2055893 RepID=A0A343TKU0_9EURY|nr:DUF5807 family protein [Halalkaliarchaeum desulfuricum]AUX09712.1 hypothetical protein AArcSl_2087 [Halalkaliarchaeum desulfuricum]
MSKLDGFLAGQRLDDVAIFVSDAHLEGAESLTDLGESVDSGVVIVVPGENGRQAFSAGTGIDAMEFAKEAMGTEGTIGRRLDSGVCPVAGEIDTGNAAPGDSAPGDSAPDQEGDHEPEFVFAFAEEQNEEVGGLYAEGDVIHAYAQCSCGESYSHKWVVGDRDA